jgi:prepilin peptidase dependent protein B
MLTCHPVPRLRRGAGPRGLSLIELLVGVAVSLIVVGGAIGLFVNNLVSSRQLLAETRLNQDLRATVDLLTRDLRRAGYWGNAISGTQAIGAGAATTQNPYSTVTPVSASEISYGFSRGAENNALDANEQFGLRLSNGAIQMQSGSGAWVDLTDTRSITITGFTITPTTTTLPLGHLCPKVCAVGAPNCPTVTVRNYAVLVQGQSVNDPSLQRSLRSDLRVRNDRLAGACPV